MNYNIKYNTILKDYIELYCRGVAALNALLGFNYVLVEELSSPLPAYLIISIKDHIDSSKFISVDNVRSKNTNCLKLSQFVFTFEESDALAPVKSSMTIRDWILGQDLAVYDTTAMTIATRIVIILETDALPRYTITSPWLVQGHFRCIIALVSGSHRCLDCSWLAEQLILTILSSLVEQLVENFSVGSNPNLNKLSSEQLSLYRSNDTHSGTWTMFGSRRSLVSCWFWYSCSVIQGPNLTTAELDNWTTVLLPSMWDSTLSLFAISSKTRQMASREGFCAGDFRGS